MTNPTVRKDREPAKPRIPTGLSWEVVGPGKHFIAVISLVNFNNFVNGYMSAEEVKNCAFRAHYGQPFGEPND